MTDRIRHLKEYQRERKHHAQRVSLPEGIEAAYRKEELSDVSRGRMFATATVFFS